MAILLIFPLAFEDAFLSRFALFAFFAMPDVEFGVGSKMAPLAHMLQVLEVST
jgi:hypothetical protein